MHVHGTRLADEAYAPHLLEQLLAGEHAALVLHECAQKVELLACEVDFPAIRHHGAGGRRQLDRADGHKVTGFRHLFCGALARTARAPQQRVYSRDEFHHAEGFRQIVVGTGIEPHYFVELGALGREHHDGEVLGRCIAAQGLQQNEAVVAGQHNVQQHRIGRLDLTPLNKTVAIVERTHFHTRLMQRIGSQVADMLVVFHVIDERGFAHGNPFWNRCAVIVAQQPRDAEMGGKASKSRGAGRTGSAVPVPPQCHPVPPQRHLRATGKIRKMHATA